jgi:putative GTP pyrophosphokinase
MTEQDLRRIYSAARKDLGLVRDRIVNALESSLETTRYVDHVYGRVKTSDHFVEKALSSSGRYPNPFKDVEDIIGVRILVLFQSTSKLVAETVYKRISMPVENEYRREPDPRTFGYEGYQSIHRITGDYLEGVGSEHCPNVFELQIRTLFQHAWEEPEHELNYKNKYLGKLEGEELYHYKRRVSWVAASAWGCDGILDQLIQEYETMKKQ